MIKPSTYTRHGLVFIDPSSVKLAKRDQYRLHTGQVMHERGLYQGSVDFDSLYDIEDAFNILPETVKHDVLQDHRRRAAERVMADHYRTRYVQEVNMDEAPLRWSYIRDTLFASLENAEDVLANHKKTAHSYATPAISNVFDDAGQDRLYLPMNQFTPHNSMLRDDMLVISRHPYDLTRCTSYRAWTNCMDPRMENYSPYLSANIRQGTIICYRAKGESDDWRNTDWNLDSPLNRCLMQPYRDDHNNILYLEDHTYGENGSNGKAFQEAVICIRRDLFSRNAKVATEYYIEDGLYTGNRLDDTHTTSDADIPTDTAKKKTFTP